MSISAAVVEISFSEDQKLFSIYFLVCTCETSSVIIKIYLISCRNNWHVYCYTLWMFHSLLNLWSVYFKTAYQSVCSNLVTLTFKTLNYRLCVAAVEWTPPAARLWPPAFLPFCFSLGTMGGAPLAWLSPTWRQLHLSLALPQLVCLPLYL